MRGILIVAVGAVALSACAPFEHGHYAEDVRYVNSGGDPAGTPIVFNSNYNASAETTEVANHGNWQQNGYYATPAPPAQQVALQSYPQISYAPATYADPAYGQSITYAPQAVQSHTLPVEYSVPQVYAAPVAYLEPATQNTYAASTLGGIRFDAEGYAICDETYPQGVQMPQHLQMPHYATTRTY